MKKENELESLVKFFSLFKQNQNKEEKFWKSNGLFIGDRGT